MKDDTKEILKKAGDSIEKKDKVGFSTYMKDLWIKGSRDICEVEQDVNERDVYEIFDTVVNNLTVEEIKLLVTLLSKEV